jgi:hypothetical protein
MIQDLSDLALGANRVLSYAGYVLLAGTFTFWSVVCGQTAGEIAASLPSHWPELPP